MTTERYFAGATADQLRAAAAACRRASAVDDEAWDTPEAEEALRLTDEFDWIWDFASWAESACILEREADLADAEAEEAC